MNWLKSFNSTRCSLADFFPKSTFQGIFLLNVRPSYSRLPLHFIESRNGIWAQIIYVHEGISTSLGHLEDDEGLLKSPRCHEEVT